MPLRTRFFVAFGSVWFLCYVFYPTWWLPVPQITKLIVASFFIFYFVINLVLVDLWIKKGGTHEFQDRQTKQKVFSIPTHLVIIFSINFLCHLYPMFLPIPFYGDQLYHAYASQVMLGYLNSWWVNYLGFPFFSGHTVAYMSAIYYRDIGFPVYPSSVTIPEPVKVVHTPVFSGRFFSLPRPHVSF